MLSNNIKIAFVSFFISFVVLFPTSVFVAINFIDLSHDNAKQAEAKPEFIISKEQDMNMLLTVCRKNPEPADVYIIIKISAHDKLISIANLPSDTTTMVNTKQGSLKELFDWGGIDYVKLAVENLMDITIDRTVKADNYAIESIVDKLGGIEMTLPECMTYENISLTSGRQLLDGVRFCAVLRNQPINAMLAIGDKLTTQTDISSTFLYIANLCVTDISAYDIELHKNGWKQMIKDKNVELIIPQLEFETLNKHQKLTNNSKDECIKAFSKD